MPRKTPLLIALVLFTAVATGCASVERFGKAILPTHPAEKQRQALEKSIRENQQKIAERKKKQAASAHTKSNVQLASFEQDSPLAQESPQVELAKSGLSSSSPAAQASRLASSQRPVRPLFGPPPIDTHRPRASDPEPAPAVAKRPTKPLSKRSRRTALPLVTRAAPLANLESKQTAPPGSLPTQKSQAIPTQVPFTPRPVQPISSTAKNSYSPSPRGIDYADQLLARGNTSQALQHIEVVLARSSSKPHNRIEAAALLLKHNQPEHAQRYAHQAVLQMPESSVPLRTLGLAYYRGGAYDKAQPALRKALSLDRSHALTYFLLGQTERKLGNHETAQRLYEHAARLDPRYRSH